MSESDANEVLDRLNRALAELGMPAAALELGSGVNDFGEPEARLRLVYAADPGKWYGEIRVTLYAGDRRSDG